MHYVMVLAPALAAGCQPSFPRYSRVHSLAVLAIVAEPPEIAPGEATRLSALAVDPDGRPVALEWAACALPPPAGEPVDRRCVAGEEGEFLTPLGAGAAADFTLPPVDAGALGLPDATAGVYYPIRLTARAGEDRVVAIYRLRVASAAGRNHNPTLDGLFAEGKPLEEGALVRGGAPIALSPRVAGSETYLGYDLEAGSLAAKREQLRLSWFSTDGDFAEDHTGGDLPDNAWTPACAREAIDLWLVARDERGGAAWIRRALRCGS
jgi:hypothetical protein